MANIYALNKNYDGITAGVVFTRGIAKTNDIRQIEYFEKRGYIVQRDTEEMEWHDLRKYTDEQIMNMHHFQELKPLAVFHGIYKKTLKRKELAELLIEYKHRGEINDNYNGRN